MNTRQNYLNFLLAILSTTLLVAMTSVYFTQQHSASVAYEHASVSSPSQIPHFAYQVQSALSHFGKKLTQLESILKSAQAESHRSSKYYIIKGRKYYPFKSTLPKFSQNGIASWYGPGFHGRKTASGEIYDQNAMTAAHKELPLNSIVRVTNIRTGKSIIVKINDRGPFHGNRIIDLSKAAAEKLDLIEPGKGQVHIELLKSSNQYAQTAQDSKIIH